MKKQNRMYMYKVILSKNKVKKRSAETSSMLQAEELALKWKRLKPDHDVLIVGSLYTVYRML